MSQDAAPIWPDSAVEARWRRSVEAVLKGRAFEAVMTTRSEDGVLLQPLYPRSPPDAAQPRRLVAPVRVIQPIDHPDPWSAQQAATDEVAGGADGLTLVGIGAPGAHGFGLLWEEGVLARVLDGLALDRLVLRVDAHPAEAARAAALVAALVERRGLDPAALSIDLGADPGAALALRRRGFTGPVTRADGRPFHEAGATEAQELASVLAAGVAALRGLDAAGVTAGELSDAFAVVLVAETDILMTVAKLRAWRRLWGRVTEACGLADAPAALHAETAWRSLTRLDPWTNAMRGGVAAAAAILGGADSLTVLPVTAALGLADGAARRLARNTGRILLDEAHLAATLDPAAGAGAFEHATAALCEQAWTLFQGIESGGGLAAAMRSGAWPAALAESRSRRADEVAAGQRPILGATVFAAPHGPCPPVLAELPASWAGPAAPDLPSIRIAAASEAAGLAAARP